VQKLDFRTSPTQQLESQAEPTALSELRRFGFWVWVLGAPGMCQPWCGSKLGC